MQKAKQYASNDALVQAIDVIYNYGPHGKFVRVEVGRDTGSSRFKRSWTIVEGSMTESQALDLAQWVASCVYDGLCAKVGVQSELRASE